MSTPIQARSVKQLVKVINKAIVSADVGSRIGDNDRKLDLIPRRLNGGLAVSELSQAASLIQTSLLSDVIPENFTAALYATDALEATIPFNQLVTEISISSIRRKFSAAAKTILNAADETGVIYSSNEAIRGNPVAMALYQSLAILAGTTPAQ